VLFRSLNDQAKGFNKMLAGLRSFETYVPRTLVKKLIGEDKSDAIASQNRELMVMFTDIAGFTAMSEGQPAQETAAFINEHFALLGKCVEEEGGTILCGGGPPSTISERCKDGYFVEPTVITNLSVNCRVNQEEIFGPVVTITPFSNEDEVIEYANSTDYGLAASVWTNDVSRAHRVARRIASGTVWVNCWMIRDLRVPFGGMKQSGVGREGGQEALRFYTEPKNICIKMS